jgi:NitT/TauT family transport system ATP-binding protein
MVTSRFAEQQPDEHAALVAALAEAGAWCDEPQNRDALGTLLSQAAYLNVRAATILPTLRGRFDCGHGRVERAPDFFVFHRGDAGVPTAAKAAGIQNELRAAGLLPAGVDPQLPQQLFREDLHHHALSHANHGLVSTIEHHGGS